MSKPNILFILTDDLGWGDLSCHNSHIKTPNIDRLMKGGVEFTQHYVCPVCTPTRASLMTGMFPARFGKHATTPTNLPVLREGYKTLASHLRENGYDTGLFGKWHLGSKPEYCANNFGFNTSYGSLAGGVDPYNHHYKTGEYSRTWHKNGEFIDEQGHVTDLLTDKAVEWIETRTRPWFCYVPFTAVHIPVKAPSRWLSMYESERFNYDPEMDASFKRYAAYTSHMDYSVGRLYDALQCSCQLENTIIIFSSDNGAMPTCDIKGSDLYPGWHWDTSLLGSNLPFRGRKGQMYEGGVRTPTLIFQAGKIKPGKCEHPVYVGDWLPTLTKLTGGGIDESKLDSKDIWPLVTGENRNPEKRTIYWNMQNKLFALRHGDWKVIDSHRDNDTFTELYNIAEDPYEKKDMAAQKPELVKKLLNMIEQERKKDGSLAREMPA